MSVRADLLNMIMEFLVLNQKTNCLRGFEPFFNLDVKTKKPYFFSLIFLTSKKFQKSGSTCPWESIYWACVMEFLVFNQTTDSLRGFEPVFHFDVKTKKLHFFMLIWPVSKICSTSRKLKNFSTDFHKKNHNNEKTCTPGIRTPL